jgi:hypothetical protein
MAVDLVATYLYVDASLNQYYVQGSRLVDRGPWSPVVFYHANDVIQLATNQYVALKTNINVRPIGLVDENWSSLVLISQVPVWTVTGTDYYARALGQQGIQWGQSAMAVGTTAYIVGTAAHILAGSALGLFSSVSVAYFDTIVDLRAADRHWKYTATCGGLVIDDGFGADYWYNGTSLAADNATSIIKPNDVAVDAPGRWVQR